MRSHAKETMSGRMRKEDAIFAIEAGKAAEAGDAVGYAIATAKMKRGELVRQNTNTSNIEQQREQQRAGYKRQGSSFHEVSRHHGGLVGNKTWKQAAADIKKKNQAVKAFQDKAGGGWLTRSGSANQSRKLSAAPPSSAISQVRCH